MSSKSCLKKTGLANDAMTHEKNAHCGWNKTVSYLVARLMVRGFGGGISRHTEGISMSRPPGPVTSHLLR